MSFAGPFQIKLFYDSMKQAHIDYLLGGIQLQMGNPQMSVSTYKCIYTNEIAKLLLLSVSG